MKKMRSAGARFCLQVGCVALGFWIGSGVAGDIRGFAQSSTPRVDRFNEAVGNEIASLVPVPRTTVLTNEKAAHAVAAISQGAYDTAKGIVANLLAASRAATWRSYPMNVLMQNIVGESDDDFIAKLSAWVDRDGESPIPYLVRAQNYLELGWRIRGDKFAALTRADHLARFVDYMHLSETDIRKSIERDGNIPYSYFLLLRSLRGLGNSADLETAFLDGIAKFPEYYPLYKIRLDALAPKWGGSVGAMYSFIARYADKAGAASPRKLLYLDLYAGLLNTASGACRAVAADGFNACVTANMDRLVTHDLESKIQIALARLGEADSYEFSIAVAPILSDMLNDRGGASYLGAIMQLAADAVGSSNQLVDEKSDHNNFVLDKTSAAIWMSDQMYDNAEKKYKQALQDLEWTPFPDEEQRDVARADIYDGLAGVYKQTGQFSDVIAYRSAALLLAGNRNRDLRYLVCYAYFRLKRFDDAIRECTLQIDASGDLHSRYWRAEANIALGKPDAARDDLSRVADTEDSYRVSAAIALSVVYADLRDYQAMLDGMNRHSYLFDERIGTKRDLAIAFNNRCYAYMKLGRRREALDDCTASLRYDSLPDAFQKQQELVKELQAK